MAAIGEDFLVGDDLDLILAMLEEDIPIDNEDFVAEVDSFVGEVIEASPDAEFSCEQCSKVCKTKRGLTRHKSTKHVQTDAGTTRPTSNPIGKTPEEMLHPLYFKKYVNLSASKLSSDGCYSEKTCKEFEGYEVSLDDANESYRFVRDVIGEFKGNAEKFYPKFYKCVSDNIIFKNLSRRSSVLLGCELANHVLAHLTGSNVKESSVEFHKPAFSTKEVNIIKYLNGYVFGTVYRRIRRCKSSQTMFGVQSSDILLAGKSSVEDSSCENDVLIRAKDRGGLWNVTCEVYEIFSQVETTFRQSTSSFGHKIDSKRMVSQLLKNPSVLLNFNKVRSQSVEKVSKEIALNLLEHLIMLYIRVRTFSLVKDKIELHKIASKRKKARSLRTEIKKASSSLDQ